MLLCEYFEIFRNGIFIEDLFIIPFHLMIDNWDVLDLNFTTANFTFTKICKQLKLQREASILKLNNFGFKFSQVYIFQNQSPGGVLLKRCGLQLY